jgi:phosphoribosylformylglycinamidine synthase
MKKVKAAVITGYGLNCDYETDFSLRLAGADSHRIHINRFIGVHGAGPRVRLEEYHILVLGGGFSWGDEHGAGVLMASKLRHHLGVEIEQFLAEGKLILGICNGFQALANLGLLPGFESHPWERRVAVTYNDSGNFVDTWVRLRINPQSPCVFTYGLSFLELPVRHGEGKVIAAAEDMDRIAQNAQLVVQYSDPEGNPAEGKWPLNPNGSLRDAAGICDPTGRIFGIMPHPEAFNHYTNHPNWTRHKEMLRRQGESIPSQEGQGVQIFRNAVKYVQATL